MSQAEILKILDKNIEKLQKEIKKIDDEDLLLDKLWTESFTKDDFINVLGISLHSVSRSLRKLALQDKIIMLKNKKEDKRKVRYTANDKLVTDMVNKRTD